MTTEPPVDDDGDEEEEKEYLLDVGRVELALLTLVVRADDVDADVDPDLVDSPELDVVELDKS